MRRVQLEPEPELAVVIAWLRANAPISPLTVLVHGDFKPGNVLLEGDEVTAILDWETVHLGDPHEDLGWVTNPLRAGEHRIADVWEPEQFLAHWSGCTGIKVDASFRALVERLGQSQARRHRAHRESRLCRPPSRSLLPVTCHALRPLAGHDRRLTCVRTSLSRSTGSDSPGAGHRAARRRSLCGEHPRRTSRRTRQPGCRVGHCAAVPPLGRRRDCRRAHRGAPVSGRGHDGRPRRGDMDHAARRRPMCWRWRSTSGRLRGLLERAMPALSSSPTSGLSWSATFATGSHGSLFR